MSARFIEESIQEIVAPSHNCSRKHSSASGESELLRKANDCREL